MRLAHNVLAPDLRHLGNQPNEFPRCVVGEFPVRISAGAGAAQTSCTYVADGCEQFSPPRRRPPPLSSDLGAAVEPHCHDFPPFAALPNARLRSADPRHVSALFTLRL